MTSTAHDVVPFEGRFPSWEALDVARQAHCERTYTMYVCRNTVKVAVANKRRKLQVPDSWVYDRKVYVCTHGYKRVSRSGGSRPRQNVRYTDCKARFTACVASELTEDGGEVLFIKVTGQHLVHSDHPLSLEQWRMYSQNRAAVIEHPYLTHEADLMRRIGSNKKAARAHIEGLTGKVCTMKDMHNLYAKLKKREKSAPSMDSNQSRQPPLTISSSLVGSGVPQSRTTPNSSACGARVELILQNFVDADVENHASILSADDGSNEAICLASRAMKEHFQVFPELLILDVTSAAQETMQAEQHLHGFLSMDALGNARPIFLARSLAMSPSLLRRVCQDFKRTHPKWIQMKALVMSKLLRDVVQVLAHEFPQAQLLLCQFHVLQLLNDLLAHTQIPDRNSSLDKVRHLLRHLVFAHSELRYNETKALLVRQLIIADKRELLDMFDRNWEPYRALWVSYTRAEPFDFSLFLTKGMNSYWDPMQSAFRRTRDNNSAEPAATNVSHLATEAMPLADHAAAPREPFQYTGSAAGSQTSPALSNSPAVTALYRDAEFARSTTSNVLAKCTAEVLTTIKFVESDWNSKILILELTKPVAVDRYDPLLLLLINCLSGFAVDVISSQLTNQTSGACGSVTVTKTRTHKAHSASSTSGSSESPASPTAEATVRWLNKTTREKHILQRDGSACDCEFFAMYQLPCRHLIWYEVVALQHKQLSLAAVGSRWFLRSFQAPKLARQRESNEIEYHLL
ncbi:hypothetical protein PR003_g2660 [Phytophthora rubi]|uniref:SWIM-type domain-containing protein n=1 Tax=Phytophthora rubi TaxID=129364 RepID=A0A6A3NUN6_9STRA|nr:hypothetical protein PR002_g2558 [Phytophthora rubi]KAE9050396.1 hypothetical protein PR001_g2445 [Phytophthora rubi]KAE9355776.1 hypothetical protein PR003_g2660 [Phytophthora rubi]